MASCSELASLAGEAAFKEAQDFDACSSLVNHKNSPKLRRVDWNELQVGKLLGLGNFSSVKQVSWNEKDYAIKMLRRDKISEPFHVGATDLVLEGKILRNLQHENIIQLHGVSGVSLQHDMADFFLILQRLHGTLDQSLLKWRLFHHKQLQIQKVLKHDEALLNRRKRIALGIARGMEYLHSRHVVYRDLKPHNIGFDECGHVKIFDFGLARDLDSYESTTYRGRLLTARVGTPRYMAPENMLGRPYGLSSDVYSFAVLLWEILTLQIAYQDVTMDQVESKIGTGNLRPSLKKTNGSTSPPIKQLIKSAWHADPCKRPTFSTICAQLENDIYDNWDEWSTQSSEIMSNNIKLCRIVKRAKNLHTKTVSSSTDSRRKRLKLKSCFLKACAA